MEAFFTAAQELLHKGVAPLWGLLMQGKEMKVPFSEEVEVVACLPTGFNRSHSGAVIILEPQHWATGIYTLGCFFTYDSLQQPH